MITGRPLTKDGSIGRPAKQIRPIYLRTPELSNQNGIFQPIGEKVRPSLNAPTVCRRSLGSRTTSQQSISSGTSQDPDPSGRLLRSESTSGNLPDEDSKEISINLTPSVKESSEESPLTKSQEEPEIDQYCMDGVGSVCTEVCSNVDTVLTELDDLRNQVIMKLVENPEICLNDVWKNTLSMDRSCKFRMDENGPSLRERLESGSHPLASDRFFKCKGCRTLKVIMPPKICINDGSFSPECGNFQGLKYSILKISDVYPKIISTDKQRHIINEIAQHNQLAKACQPQLSILASAKYYGLDPFTNQLVINWYLEKVLAKTAMPHCRKIYYGCICHNDGYLLKEDGKYRKLYDPGLIDRFSVLSIMYQIFALFHRLKNYDLSFHLINSETIILEDTPCCYKYDEMSIFGNATIKINDLTGAGITISSIDEPDTVNRIYRSSTRLEKQFDKKLFQSINWSRHYELATSPGLIPDSWVSYRMADNGLEQEQVSTFLYANRMGLPLYQSSFDVYRIMLIFVSNPAIYDFIIDDPELYLIWRSFWVDSEYSMVQEKIISYQRCMADSACTKKEQNNQPGIFLFACECPVASILNGVTLRCDIVNHIWSQLKQTKYEQT